MLGRQTRPDVRGRRSRTPVRHGDARTRTWTGDVVAWRNRMLAGRDVPTVDVFVTVAGEPLELVARTARAARDLRLPHATWVLDDGRSDELLAFCWREGIGYLRRPDRGGAKAG